MSRGSNAAKQRRLRKPSRAEKIRRWFWRVVTKRYRDHFPPFVETGHETSRNIPEFIAEIHKPLEPMTIRILEIDD